MIGILGDQHLGDQRFGGDAALDDAGRRWRLNHRALARAAAVARPAGDQHPERDRHHVEPFGYILADLVERAATAGAGPDTINLLDIDELLDPFEVRGQRATVGLARPIARRAHCLRQAGSLGMGQCRFGILEPQLELIGIELLGTTPEAMALEGIDDRLQALDLGVGALQLAGLVEDERAERINVVGKVRFHQHGGSESTDHGPVNRQSEAPAVGVRHARDASPDPPEERRAAPPSRA